MAINFNTNSVFNLKPINKDNVKKWGPGTSYWWRGSALCISDSKSVLVKPFCNISTLFLLWDLCNPIACLIRRFVIVIRMRTHMNVLDVRKFLDSSIEFLFCVIVVLDWWGHSLRYWNTSPSAHYRMDIPPCSCFALFLMFRRILWTY